MTEVAQATVGMPHLQKQATDIADRYIRQKQAQQLREGQTRGGIGQTRQPPTERKVPTDAVEEVVAIDEAGSRPARVAPDTTPVSGDAGVRDMRQAPQFEQQSGDSPLLSRDEIADITEPFILSGDTEGMSKALADARADKLRERELQIQANEAKTRELERQRALETELAQGVLSNTRQLLAKNGLLNRDDPQVSEQWNRLAYDYFQTERQKNPSATDQDLWNRAGRRVERKINDIAGASNKQIRPTFRANKSVRADQAQRWAQDHLKTYGNTPEDRELLKSVLMDNAWSRAEATSVVQPFSEGLKNAFSRLPRMKGNATDIRPNEQRMSNFQNWKEKAIPAIQNQVSGSDSIFLLKDNLVREKGLTDEEAVDFINELRDNGLNLMEHQVAESAYLGENTIPSLWDIFSKDRKFTEWTGRII